MTDKRNVFSNLLWRFLERTGAQGVTFVVSIILARLLDPTAYGTVALITVITAIMQVFVDSGLGNALIQKKDADDLDFSSVFYFNLAMCILLYAVMFFAAPYIAEFYALPELRSMVRVVSLVILVSGVKNVQQAYVSRNLLFKRFFFSTLGGTIGAAGVGILLAYLGFGAWALIFQLLFNTVVDTLILWVTVKWRPVGQFSGKRLKVLFSFGWKLLVSALIETIYNSLQQMVIGKVYTPAELAQYNQGDKIPNVIVKNVNTSIDSVLLPVLSEKQDSKETVKNMTRHAIKTSTYVMMPLMVGLAVCAEPLVSIVLTEKWLPCVPYIRIFCLVYAFWPVHTTNLNAIMAMGRSDMYLRLQVIKKLFGFVVLIISMQISVMAMAYGMLITTSFSQIVNAWPNKKLLNYSFIDQIKDIMPQIILSIVMGGVVYSIQFISLNQLVILILQIIVGMNFYIIGSVFFHVDSFKYIQNIIKNYMKRK